MAGRELKESSLLLLTALADGPKHGYVLLHEVEQLSSGRIRMQVGSLYAALDRLARDGLVAVAHEEIVQGRTRRYLELTDAGVAELEAQTERLEATARQARARLRARATGRLA